MSRERGASWRGPGSRRAAAGTDQHPERGSGIVEFSLILPVFLLLLLVMLEFGLAFNHHLTLGYASREGARTGSALANGATASCLSGGDPTLVDEQVIAAAQRILKSPGSDIVLAEISQIRIYKANAGGRQVGGLVNIWTYTPGAGPDIEPGPLVDRLDFSEQSVAWPACARDNGRDPDSIGVEIRYRYRFSTPLSSLVAMLGGSQAATFQLDDRTVMALNPTS